MQAMLNRMCWNSNGWLQPSGTSRDNGYPDEMGFGHEEWNFNTHDAVDGFVYGYLYYQPSLRVLAKSGSDFWIGFWSINSETREHILVGVFPNATLPTEEDYTRVDEVFTTKGIYERRASELRAVVPTLSASRALREMQNAVRQHWLSFKCPARDVVLLSEYVPIQEVIRNRTIGAYFTHPTFISSSELSAIQHRLARQSVSA